MQELLDQHGFEDTRVLIETGTGEGGNLAQLAPLFREAHSIELSLKMYNKASWHNFNRGDGVVHLGDSADVFPTMLHTFDEPVVAYLDAHYFEHPLAEGSVFPLWRELEALSDFPHRALVLVDDWHTFGKKRPELAAHEKTDRHWEHVTKDSILDALDRDRVIESFVWFDAFVVYLDALK